MVYTQVGSKCLFVKEQVPTLLDLIGEMREGVDEWKTHQALVLVE